MNHDLFITRDETYRCLRVCGEIDLATAPKLDEALAEALRTWPSVDIDMAGVSFIDSSGICVLIRAAACVQTGGEIRLRCVPPMVERVLKIAGIDELAPIRLG